MAMVSASSAFSLSTYAFTPSAPAPYTMVTKGRPISTASAPRARALNTSMPVRMPPSTRMVILPPTASAMAGSTSAVAGHWSSTRPPWLETTMPAAPASRAFFAPATVMMPWR